MGLQNGYVEGGVIVEVGDDQTVEVVGTIARAGADGGRPQGRRSVEACVPLAGPNLHIGLANVDQVELAVAVDIDQFGCGNGCVRQCEHLAGDERPGACPLVNGELALVRSRVEVALLDQQIDVAISVKVTGNNVVAKHGQRYWSSVVESPILVVDEELNGIG